MNIVTNTGLKITMIIMLTAGIFIAYMCFGNQTFFGTIMKVNNKPVPPTVSSGIIINEVMSDNNGYYVGDQAPNCDWIELYNTTDSDINMQNYALSDKIGKLDKWPFPNVTVKAHEYLVIFLTGDIESDIEKRIIHCSFKLDSSGDVLLLVDPEGRLADSVNIPRLKTNISFGRSGEQWQQFDCPTPGFENTDNAGFS